MPLPLTIPCIAPRVLLDIVQSIEASPAVFQRDAVGRVKTIKREHNDEIAKPASPGCSKSFADLACVLMPAMAACKGAGATADCDVL
jgi:hypothetical protein